ncbi:MAG TPA: HAMP domain-containing sensor histidine kinase [Clostridia bacterium]|nr:HAMP domain-containing sensor histidine kinase [Clostridia bacterium]
MFSSIKQKIVLIYIFLMFIPLIIINYTAIENIKRSTFRDIEVDSLKTANIIGDLSRDSMDNLVNLKRIAKRYSSTPGERVVILDKNARILADSFHTLEDEIVHNDEVRGALDLEEKIGYYNKEDKNILQVAVPVSIIVENQRQVTGAVLISANIDDAVRHIADFRVRLISISIGAAVVGIIVAAIVSNKISGPIVKLSEATRQIERGKFGYTVDIKGKDEIGKLAGNFNLMSGELYRIDKGRNQFIGDVSHELKTPLASIKALIDSLLYGKDDIKIYKEYLKDIDSEVDRLTNLIQKLLNLTKITEQGLNLTEAPLAELIEDSIKVVKPLVQSSNVRITVDIQNNPTVLCDPERIVEVLINLIDNSLKYTDLSKTERYVDIMGQNMTNFYLLSIEDNGIGIKEKDLESIFEKFYRSDFSRSRDTGGAGIGLSIVYNILKAHNWKIEVESRQGRGTIFKIKIPNKFLLIP